MVHFSFVYRIENSIELRASHHRLYGIRKSRYCVYTAWQCESTAQTKTQQKTKQQKNFALCLAHLPAIIACIVKHIL